MSPDALFRKLKQQPGYFNYQKQTLAGLLAGRDQTLKERVQWAGMRMDPTDIADVTGATYTYLVNGHGPRDNWTALFTPGQRIRLRTINASAMTTFNVRIPGLPLTVVQADGQNVRPTTVDEFQIGVAETYDVIVSPRDNRAYTVVGESVDRSGLARATLAPRPGMIADVPPLRPRPVATMTDMGMGMSGMQGMQGMDHSGMKHGGMNHADTSMDMRNPKNAPSVAMTPGVQTISPVLAHGPNIAPSDDACYRSFRPCPAFAAGKWHCSGSSEVGHRPFQASLLVSQFENVLIWNKPNQLPWVQRERHEKALPLSLPRNGPECPRVFRERTASRWAAPL